jgi:hypothetical protein
MKALVLLALLLSGCAAKVTIPTPVPALEEVDDCNSCINVQETPPSGLR